MNVKCERRSRGLHVRKSPSEKNKEHLDDRSELKKEMNFNINLISHNLIGINM